MPRMYPAANLFPAFTKLHLAVLGLAPHLRGCHYGAAGVAKMVILF